jgi:hypothetical protein
VSDRYYNRIYLRTYRRAIRNGHNDRRARELARIEATKLSELRRRFWGSTVDPEAGSSVPFVVDEHGNLSRQVGG